MKSDAGRPGLSSGRAGALVCLSCLQARAPEWDLAAWRPISGRPRRALWAALPTSTRRAATGAIVLNAARRSVPIGGRLFAGRADLAGHSAGQLAAAGPGSARGSAKSEAPDACWPARKWASALARVSVRVVRPAANLAAGRTRFVSAQKEVTWERALVLSTVRPAGRPARQLLLAARRAVEYASEAICCVPSPAAGR